MPNQYAIKKIHVILRESKDLQPLMRSQNIHKAEILRRLRILRMTIWKLLP